MKRHFEQVKGRRQLLAAALRYGTLGLLGTMGGSILDKRRRLLREGKCINHGVCRDCEVLETCGLPQALSEKAVKMELDDRVK